MNEHLSTAFPAPPIACDLKKTVAVALSSRSADQQPPKKLVAKVLAAQKALTDLDHRMQLCNNDAFERAMADERLAYKEGRISKLSAPGTVKAAFERENNLLVEMQMDISNEITPTNNALLEPTISHMEAEAEALKAADHAACEKWSVPVCCGMPYHGLMLAIRLVKAQIKTGINHGARPKDCLAGIVDFPTA